MDVYVSTNVSTYLCVYGCVYSSMCLQTCLLIYVSTDMPMDFLMCLMYIISFLHGLVLYINGDINVCNFWQNYLGHGRSEVVYCEKHQILLEPDSF